MTASALFLAIMGIGLIFMPLEIAASAGISFTKAFGLMLQVLGAMYFAFAMLNWTAKGAHIGGIYNKPIAMANLTHFVIGGLALLKSLMHDPAQPYAIWAITGIYTIFAILFGLIFFRDPVSDSRTA